MSKESRLHPVDGSEEYVVEKNYILKNPQLPSRLTKINWQPWMIEEIEKCRNDVLYFAENYFTIINLDLGRIKIPLYDIQKKILTMMVKENRMAVVSSRQMGKCVCKDSVIKVRFKPLGIAFKMKIGTFYKMQKIINWLSGLTRHKTSTK